MPSVTIHSCSTSLARPVSLGTDEGARSRKQGASGWVRPYTVNWKDINVIIESKKKETKVSTWKS